MLPTSITRRDLLLAAGGLAAAPAGIHAAQLRAGFITDEQWTKAARRHFKGQVILGRDLMEM